MGSNSKWVKMTAISIYTEIVNIVFLNIHITEIQLKQKDECFEVCS